MVASTFKLNTGADIPVLGLGRSKISLENEGVE